MNYTREVRPSRRAWHRLTFALVGSIMAAATVLPTGAFAVPPQPPKIQLGDDPPPPQTVPACHSLAWSVPTVKIHVAEFSGNRAAMEDAVRDVNAQIALVGGSMVRIASTVVTTDPFHYTPYNDNSPVIHVGFQSILEPNTLANTWNLWPCEHDITVDTGRTWNYGTPDDPGIERYYEAGMAGPVGDWDVLLPQHLPARAVARVWCWRL